MGGKGDSERTSYLPGLRWLTSITCASTKCEWSVVFMILSVHQQTKYHIKLNHVMYLQQYQRRCEAGVRWWGARGERWEVRGERWKVRWEGERLPFSCWWAPLLCARRTHAQAMRTQWRNAVILRRSPTHACMMQHPPLIPFPLSSSPISTHHCHLLVTITSSSLSWRGVKGVSEETSNLRTSSLNW